MPRTRSSTKPKRGAGKHHRIDIKLRDSVPEGTLDFYSDNFTMHLRLKKSGISGSSIVSGKDHAAKLTLSSQNKWSLEYLHTKDDRTMKVFAKLGKVTKATSLFAYGVRFKKEGMTRADITHTGQSHKMQLKLHSDGEYEFKIKVKVGGGNLSISKSRKHVEAEASFTF